MSYLNSTWLLNSNLSGQLAEDFCKKHFNISEPKFEIKCASKKNNSFILRVCQLLDNLHKQHVMVIYNRKRRVITRGPRKGSRVFDESLIKAFERKVDVYVIQGFHILELISKHRLPTQVTKQEDWNWSAFYRLPVRLLSQDLIISTEFYNLYGEEIHIPQIKEELTYEDKVPF